MKRKKAVILQKGPDPKPYTLYPNLHPVNVQVQVRVFGAGLCIWGVHQQLSGLRQLGTVPGYNLCVFEGFKVRVSGLKLGLVAFVIRVRSMGLRACGLGLRVEETAGRREGI